MGFVIQQTQKTSKQRNFSKIVDRHSGNLFYSEELILAQTQKPHIGGSTAPERKDLSWLFKSGTPCKSNVFTSDNRRMSPSSSDALDVLTLAGNIFQ